MNQPFLFLLAALLGLSLGGCLPESATDGNPSPWASLENCTLDTSWTSNDGDSFRVNYGTRQFVFRLYAVDCPETSLDFPDRVNEQAAFFRISQEEALAVGHKAAAITAELLGRYPFTVHTKWQDARGRTARFFAFVDVPTAESSIDLGGLLVSQGLARNYGMDSPHPSGLDSAEYRDFLNVSAEAAYRSRLGAWSIQTASVVSATDLR